ncbi:MAG TPA: alternative ribosome rescue aminoacyl-tRNA hydrolase ArfB [Gammaproteobacteria bacterium]|nr:alternative ribosome rescue aminoacyl-tRNA hydrolase ArfB [Gammaproteobacteria bacterium]
MVRITPRLMLDERELEFRFVRASGPGGQNVNKLATAAELRFDVNASISVPQAVKQRLRLLAANRINHDGVLVISAQRFRTQERNRADALERLVTLLRRAAVVPKKRLATRPSAASRRRRLEGKRRVADKKRLRRRGPED